MTLLTDMALACDAAVRDRRPAALVTVVEVEGSAYRRHGARMLVMPETGDRLGCVSGGCLDADVLMRAGIVGREGGRRYQRYGVDSDSGDLVLDSGCNGEVGVLIERATDPDVATYLRVLADLCSRRQYGAMATVFRSEGCNEIHPGARLIVTSHATVYGHTRMLELFPSLKLDLSASLEHRQSRTATYHLKRGGVRVLIEPVLPPPALLICGAGADALPLASAASLAGWCVTVADSKQRLLTPERFPGAQLMLCDELHSVVAMLNIDDRSAAIVMTHSYSRDMAWIRRLLELPFAYVGLLGPRRRAEKMLSEVQASGQNISLEAQSRLYAPAGLDTGADTPEEIAISITAEILAVLNGRPGGWLRSRIGSIHDCAPGLLAAHTMEHQRREPIWRA